MADPVVPRPDFAPAFRGYDRDQVDRWATRAADRIKEMEGELERFQGALSDTPLHPVPEYERIGREIGTLLEEADRLASSMREKAAAEAEEWKGQAEAEAKATREAAAADAEGMRGDAWLTASTLLEESEAQADLARQELKDARVLEFLTREVSLGLTLLEEGGRSEPRVAPHAFGVRRSRLPGRLGFSFGLALPFLGLGRCLLPHA